VGREEIARAVQAGRGGLLMSPASVSVPLGQSNRARNRRNLFIDMGITENVLS
jgi:hypothetical protein